MPSSKWARTIAGRSRTWRRSPNQASASSPTPAPRTSRDSDRSTAWPRAKGSCSRAFRPHGTAILNADDRFVSRWRSLAAGRRVMTFGLEHGRVFGTEHSIVAGGRERRGSSSSSPLRVGRCAVRLALAGMHNLRNALGAAAAAQAAGASLDDVAAGLAAMKPVKGRLEFKPAINGAVLVDDSYNANPGSLKAGLDAFRSFAGARWLVLGDMMELGTAADELHREIGLYARESGVERLLAFGQRAKGAADAFGPGGAWFEKVEDLISRGATQPAPGRRGAGQGIARQSAGASHTGPGPGIERGIVSTHDARRSPTRPVLAASPS